MIDGVAISPEGERIAIEVKSPRDDLVRGIGQCYEAVCAGYTRAILVTTLRVAKRLRKRVFQRRGIRLIGIDAKARVHRYDADGWPCWAREESCARSGNFNFREWSLDPSSSAVRTEGSFRGDGHAAELAARDLSWRKGQLTTAFRAVNLGRKETLSNLRTAAANLAFASRTSNIAQFMFLHAAAHIQSEVSVDVLLAGSTRTNDADGRRVVATIRAGQS